MRTFMLILLVLLTNPQFTWGQVNQILISDQTLLKAIDTFINEVTAEYDDYQIKDKRLGVVSVEIYNADRQLFPLGVFPIDSLASLEKSSEFEIRISMILWNNFFKRNLPSYLYMHNGRPIVFYTGIEALIKKDLKSEETFIKKLKPVLTDNHYLIFTWLMRINESNEQKILILQKKVG